MRQRPLALTGPGGDWQCLCPECDAWAMAHLQRLWSTGLHAAVEDTSEPPASWLAI